MKKHDRLLFVGTLGDKNFLTALKPCVGMASCAVILETPTTFTELAAVMKAKHATGVITTSHQLLTKLVDVSSTKRAKPSIDNYAGSLFKLPNTHDGEVVVIHPLEQLITVPYGSFTTSRYISKLTEPDKWLPTTKFNWSLFNEATFSEVLARFQTAEAIATDIETYSNPPSIRCVGYTALYFSKQTGWSSESYVIPCDSMYALACIRTLNALPAAKIFQNGKYDISYLQSYNAAPINYLWDTAEFFHSWYSELPKDLATLNSFFVRDSMYWKDLADSSDLHQYYLYNAKDTWATANVFLAWMLEAPQWAKNNYANTFPLQFPCHLSEMTGIARDEDEMEIARAGALSDISSKRARLEVLTATPGFNPNSPKQVLQLLTILGCKDITSTEEKDLKKAALRHPINSKIINLILDVRGDRKLIGTYLRTNADATSQNPKGNKEFYGHLRQHHPVTGTEGRRKQGRILYSLNPHGTDTGRLASKEHHFWCGLQIQNIPRGIAVKRTLVADNGFVIAECDLEQAESRDTAHIAGDESLIAATTGSKDFHSFNASSFFGVSYDSIYDSATGKTKDKAIRDLAKRVNHGASYNMGPMVLVDTMGEDKIREAQKLLGLPKFWTLKQVAEHLLGAFHKTYPDISKTYYTGVTAEVLTTGMITSKAVHDVEYQASPQGLIRYCFGKPSKSKQALNAYVAHCPQSLNAMTLNRAYMKVFYEIAMHPNYSKDFKLLAQIHDSILFLFREGRKDIAELVKAAMQIPVTVQGYDKKKRTFTVPAAIKAGKDFNSRRWSTIE